MKSSQVLDIGRRRELSSCGETVREHALVHDGVEVGASDCWTTCDRRGQPRRASRTRVQIAGTHGKWQRCVRQVRSR